MCSDSFQKGTSGSLEYCSVPGCSNFRGKILDDGHCVSLHKIPEGTHQKAARMFWIHNISTVEMVAHDGVRVCSAHFEGRTVGKFSIPTVFPNKPNGIPLQHSFVQHISVSSKEDPFIADSVMDSSCTRSEDYIALILQENNECDTVTGNIVPPEAEGHAATQYRTKVEPHAAGEGGVAPILQTDSVSHGDTFEPVPIKIEPKDIDASESSVWNMLDNAEEPQSWVVEDGVLKPASLGGVVIKKDNLNGTLTMQCDSRVEESCPDDHSSTHGDESNFDLRESSAVCGRNPHSHRTCNVQEQMDDSVTCEMSQKRLRLGNSVIDYYSKMLKSKSSFSLKFTLPKRD